MRLTIGKFGFFESFLGLDGLRNTRCVCRSRSESLSKVIPWLVATVFTFGRGNFWRKRLTTERSTMSYDDKIHYTSSVRFSSGKFTGRTKHVVGPVDAFPVGGFYSSGDYMNQPPISKLVDYMEKRFPVGMSTDGYLSVTGDPYVVLTSGGIKLEGKAINQDALASTEKEACRLFIREFNKFAEGKTGTLYWRNKPHSAVISSDLSGAVSPFDDGVGRFYIRARFLISNKPSLIKRIEEENGTN